MFTKSQVELMPNTERILNCKYRFAIHRFFTKSGYDTYKKNNKLPKGAVPIKFKTGYFILYFNHNV